MIDNIAWIFNVSWPYLVVLSVVGGILGIPITLYLRRRGELSCILDNPIGLVNDIAENFSNLQISYEGKPATEQLFYIKGYLMNTGNIDIDRNMIYDHFLFVPTSENIRILELSLDKEKSSIVPVVENFCFKFDLLKSDEFCAFEILLQSPANSGRPLILLQGRAKDVKIKMRKLIDFSLRFSKIQHWTLAIILPFVMIFVIFGSANFLLTEGYDTFMLFDTKYREHIYVTEVDENTIRVNAIAAAGGPPDGPRNELVPKAEVFGDKRFQFIPDRNRFAWMPYPAMIISAIIMLLVALYAIWINVRYRAIAKLLD